MSKMSYSDFYAYTSDLRNMRVDYPRVNTAIPDVIIRKAQELNLMIEGALAAADYEEE